MAAATTRPASPPSTPPRERTRPGHGLPPGDNGWAGMDGSTGTAVAMLAHIWAGTGDALSLGVPIIPTSAVPRVGTLAAGATGAYNPYFVTLAQTLISTGESNAYLRLGWEFDGGWFAWNATTPADEASFAAYFQQIVTAMRSVPGANFKFVWNPDAGPSPRRATTSPWPTRATPTSTYIGLDAYDQTWVSAPDPGQRLERDHPPRLERGRTRSPPSRASRSPSPSGAGHPRSDGTDWATTRSSSTTCGLDAEPDQRRGL